MRKNYYVGVVLPFAVLCLLTAGCASLKTNREQPLSDISGNVPEEGYKPSSQYGTVVLDHNQKVEQWINYFTGRGRKYMHIYLERSARYIPLMKAAFRERGMPDELAYIAMIESGFSPTAFSHASAVGYWQFIRETGRRYNLRIDQFVDERRDPILSTQAGANYLDSLYSLFGDWNLAMCAYNAGERRIQRAVMKYQTRDFWELTKHQKALPRETDNYVPKYIAAVLIAKDPAKYGFTDINFQAAFSFDTVVIDKPISLELLAKELNLGFQELKLMNPRYKSDYVPVYNDRVNAVRIPIGMKEATIAVMPKIITDAPHIYVAEFDYYKVKRGDTLSQIAQHYRTTIARLRDLNEFSRRGMIRVGQKIKVPDSPGAVSRKVSSERNDRTYRNNIRKTASLSRKYKSKTILKSNSQVADNGKVHVVRSGENLSVIARKYGTSIKEIAQANSLRQRSKIFVGAELIIPN
ncbi:MAG: hypothetical protein A2Z20_07245 [Bdellovibrionales bacterium RBG_16_40_8]|nr:MAG: hypothetical protein A2Z20_07245 [Bdellovibrionales bacterium RBG_16_40_8]